MPTNCYYPPGTSDILNVSPTNGALYFTDLYEKLFKKHNISSEELYSAPGAAPQMFPGFKQREEQGGPFTQESGLCEM